MSVKILNTVIAFSIIGIMTVLIRDYVYRSQISSNTETLAKATSEDSTQQATTPSPTPQPKDPSVSCRNSFFPTEVGTTWEYRLATELEIKGEKKRSTNAITNTISKASGPTIVIESTSGDNKNILQTTLTCRESGIYGFPFPVVDEDLTEFLTSKIDLLGNLGFDLPPIKFDQNMRFIPSAENFTEGSSWKSTIGVDLGLPVSIGALSLDVVSRVDSITEQNVKGAGSVQVLNIASSMSDDRKADTLATYSIAEGVGLTLFKVEFASADFGGLKSTLKLTKFSVPESTPTPSPISSSL